MLTVEEAWMLCSVAKTIDSDVISQLVMCHRAVMMNLFRWIYNRGEKAPNRIGVEMVLSMFGAVSENGTVPGWNDFLDQVQAKTIQSAWVTAGYPTPETSWCDEVTAATFEELNCLVVQDLFESSLSNRATWCLPAVGFAERSGTWVNYRH